MIELRCSHALHGRFNYETLLLEVKCQPCSRAYKQPIFHRWRLSEIIAMVASGVDVGNVSPPDPCLVHWRVRGAKPAAHPDHAVGEAAPQDDHHVRPGD